MKYLEDAKIVLMDLVDLEHCNFDHDLFDWELDIHGVSSKDARFPLVIIVNVAGGHVVTRDATQEALEAKKLASEKFWKIANAAIAAGKEAGKGTG